MINLEDTKVYTTDEELILKYTALCGKGLINSSHNSTHNEYGCEYIGVAFNGMYCFKFSAEYGQSAEKYVELTELQVRLEYTRVFDVQTETPEEKEALDAIAQVDSEEWDGEGLPPIGIKCELAEDVFECEWSMDFSAKQGDIVEILAHKKSEYGDDGCAMWHEREHLAIFLKLEHDGVKALRPLTHTETQQQREERERLERGEEMYIQHCKNMGADKFYWKEKNAESKEAWCKLSEQYRKVSK